MVPNRSEKGRILNFGLPQSDHLGPDQEKILLSIQMKCLYQERDGIAEH